MGERVADLAKELLLTRSRFNRAYAGFWHADVKPCSDDKGWEILELFRQEVERSVFKYERRDVGIKHAAWEIFRRELVDDAAYTFEEAMGFVKWYGKLKGKIAQSISHLYDFHGDSFGDLCDSYPLTGHQLVERALATHPKSNKPRREGFLEEREVGDAILEQLGLRWHKLICCGENYIEMALETACKRSYLHRVLTGRHDGVTWTPEEEHEADFACHGDDF